MESHDHVKQVCLQSRVRKQHIGWEERELDVMALSALLHTA